MRIKNARGAILPATLVLDEKPVRTPSRLTAIAGQVKTAGFQCSVIEVTTGHFAYALDQVVENAADDLTALRLQFVDDCVGIDIQHRHQR